MSKYYVTGGKDDFWQSTNAKTINGAKAVASKTYQQSTDGKIKVGQKIGEGTSERIVDVAIKYGFEKWVQA